MPKAHLTSPADHPKVTAPRHGKQKETATSALLQRLAVAPGSLRPAHILQLQRAVGNRANLRLLQAKLTLGPAGDAYEQEADRVAKQVVRASRQPKVQREGAEENEIQAKPLADSIRPIQRASFLPGPAKEQGKRKGFTLPPVVQRHCGEDAIQASLNHGMEGGDVDADVARSIQSARGGGQPLHDGVRSSMERGFGADFSGVRVHTGGQADALNRSLNARAFTTGSDIFFGKGQYNPGSTGGQELIAHELTHTVQQGAAGRRGGAAGERASLVSRRAEDQRAGEATTTQGQPLGASPQMAHLKSQSTKENIQRYATVNNYTIGGGGGAGTVVFESQGLRSQRPGANALDTGYYRQQIKTTGVGGLERQDQRYTDGGGGRAWNNDGAAVNVGGNPNIRVSANESFAIQDSGQSRFAFIQQGHLNPFNHLLQNASPLSSHYVRLTATGVTLSLNGGAGPVLDQVRAELIARNNGNVVNWVGNECNLVAQTIVGRTINRNLLRTTAQNNAPTNEASQPAIGQAYGFQANPDAPEVTEQLGKNIPKDNFFSHGFRNKMREIGNQIRPIFQNVAQGIAINYDNIGMKARMFLPGWSEHFEAVAATDGPDTLTVVNYNRTVEKNVERRRLLLEALQNPAVETAFVDFVMEKKAQAANQRLTWMTLISQTINQFFQSPAGQLALNNAQAGLVDDIRELMAGPSDTMVYFDITSGGAQSFHTKFEPYTRGTGGQTHVL